MHVVFRESHGLEEAGAPRDLGQSPADLVVLSFSDSDLGAFAAAWRAAREGMPSLRLANIASLIHPLSVDTYCENTLSGARAILIRILGGVDYWPYGIEQIQKLAARENIALAVIPADGRPDERLDAASNLPVSTLRRIAHLCDQGGQGAAHAALAQLALAGGLYADPVMGVKAMAPVGFFRPGTGIVCPLALPRAGSRPLAPVIFYRSFLTAADTGPVEAMIAALEERGFDSFGIFVPSLKAPDAAGWLRRHLARLEPDVIINATAFSARMDTQGGTPLDIADAPVLQVALANSDRKAWSEAERGLSPADLAMHVVLPEVDGRIFAGVVSFKEQEARDPDLGFARRAHCADPGQIAALAEKAHAQVNLRRKPPEQRRLALILSTYPGREDQHAHAIGLDAPASAVGLYGLLAEHDYDTGETPADGDALVGALSTSRISWPLEAYHAALAALPQSLHEALEAQWGAPEEDPDCRDGAFHFRALEHGHMITALQPERGNSADRAQEYHDLARAPRHAYIAFYLWLRHACAIDALIHLGAHGTLEWLPGKAVALGSECWPLALTGAVPVIYPFIVNDPGEAATAKRRIGALTIGHMTPPVRSGAMPETLHGLERLLDEYSTADGLDPRRRDRLVDAIIDAAQATQIVDDLQITPETCKQEAIARVDAFVCDIKETQFTDGLHVFGTPARADGEDLADTLDPQALDPQALAACPQGERAALIAALDGRFVAPGPAGSPWRGRRDVLPTGRNLFAVDPRAVPSRAAVEQGTRMAEALVMRHLQDHGDYPQGVVVDLWGSATMRTAGEDFAMAMRLIGAQPVWDHGSSRISGFEILAPAILGRPRIAVTLRISGLFRDVFPGLADLFEQAVAALRKRAEPEGENPYYAEAADTAHVFGPAPGSYGAGVDHLTQDFSRETIDKAGQDWLAASAFAYGGDKAGRYDKAGLEARVAQASAYVHAHDLAESDLLSAPDYAQHLGGFAAAARSLRGEEGGAPALYHLDTTRPEQTRIRATHEEIARLVRARASNPRWLAGQMRHGYRGAAEIAATLDQMARFAALAEVVGSHHFDLYFDATLGDESVRDFLANANPEALRQMRNRFEAMREYGYWKPLRNSVIATLAQDVPELEGDAHDTRLAS